MRSHHDPNAPQGRQSAICRPRFDWRGSFVPCRKTRPNGGPGLWIQLARIPCDQSLGYSLSPFRARKPNLESERLPAQSFRRRFSMPQPLAASAPSPPAPLPQGERGAGNTEAGQVSTLFPRLLVPGLPIRRSQSASSAKSADQCPLPFLESRRGGSATW
jgi:hypothetical protein